MPARVSRRRVAMVKLKHRNNPGKLAAWLVASHLERAPRKSEEPKTGKPNSGSILKNYDHNRSYRAVRERLFAKLEMREVLVNL